ncbi:MAG: ABC transporter permease [Acidimicrobiia bacterium]|nr:ABC transporter permease [Acidimicrobiia bacterium]MCY4456587.1 ABC transporter permease [Acidimicrobiaceae bacterium]
MNRNQQQTRAPLTLVLPALLAVALLTVPLLGLVQRAPWSSLWTHLNADSVRQAMRVSLIVSVSAAALCLLLGLPLAWVLARSERRLLRLLRALVLLPMVLPPVVAGTALLFALGRRGLIGQWLDAWLGVTLPFTTVGAVLAGTFVALPFFVITVESALGAHSRDLEEAAAVSAAGSLVAFITVTVPAARNAIGAGLALAWARALGEFGATITFAGNQRGRTATLPLQTYLALESDREAAIAMSLLLLVISLTVLISLRGSWLRR